MTFNMEEALERTFIEFKPGQIVKGYVIEVRPKEVLVDIGYKSEGIIPITEFDEPENIKPGDEEDVLIERLEDKEGNVILSKKKVAFKQNWERIQTACSEGGIISGKVKAVVKGGLIINVGIEAFLPTSQIDIIPPKNLNELVGQTFDFKIVKINQERQNIVLSRRELLEQERTERRSKLLEEMVPGDIRKGTVKNITDFGAFIDLNGIDGLLHITDMSWGRVNHPSEILKVGQEIDVVVLDINRDKERVSLGLKQKLANPWEQISVNYPIGSHVKGKVVNLVPYGAFIEGEEVEAVVIGANSEEQKISLSLRQMEVNPWELAVEKYPPGTKISGKVRNLTSYGAFIELEDGLDGMVHVSDLSWTRKINHPSEIIKKGDKVEAVVLEIDKPNQRIALGVKQLESDPWANIDQLYRVGDLITGKVTKLASFGAFIGLKNDIDGLVHISQVSEEHVDRIKNVLKIGQEVTARVIKIDKSERRIGLSIKAANYTPEQLQAEQAILDALKPGEDLVALQDAFDTLKSEDFVSEEGEKKE